MFLSYHQKNNCQAFWVKITWTAAEKPVKCRVWHRLLNRHAKTGLRAKRRFLRFARNLRPHWFGEGKRVEYFFNFGGFCLLSVSRASVSEGQVDKNQTSALVLLLDVLIHENENSLFFLLPSLRSGCDWLCPALLNAVMLTQSIQDLTQIYGQSAIFGWFVRKQRLCPYNGVNW